MLWSLQTWVQPYSMLGATAGRDSLPTFSNWSFRVTQTSPSAPTVGQFSPFRYLKIENALPLQP